MRSSPRFHQQLFRAGPGRSGQIGNFSMTHYRFDLHHRQTLAFELPGESQLIVCERNVFLRAQSLERQDTLAVVLNFVCQPEPRPVISGQGPV